MFLRRGATESRAAWIAAIAISALASALVFGTKPAEAAGPIPSFQVTPAPAAANPGTNPALQTPNDLTSLLFGTGVSLAPSSEAKVNLQTAAQLPAPNPACAVPPSPSSRDTCSPLPSFGYFSNGTADLGISDGLIMASNAGAASFGTQSTDDKIAAIRASTGPGNGPGDAQALLATARAGLPPGKADEVNNVTSLSFELEPPPPGQGRYLKFEYSLLITEVGSWNGSAWQGNVFTYPDGFGLFTGGRTPADNCAVVPGTSNYLSTETAGVVPPANTFSLGKADAEARLAARVADPNQPPTTPNGFTFPTGALDSGIYQPNTAWAVTFLSVPLTCVYDAATEIAAGDPVSVEIVIGDLNDDAIPVGAVFKADSIRWADDPTPVQGEPLTVTRSGSGSGTVSSAPGGISCGSVCTAGFSTNSTVTLTAAESPGSTFTGWSGACSGTGACQVTMDQAKSVNASFEAVPPPPTTYVLSVTKSVSDTGTGTVTSAPAGINCGGSCQKIYDPGTKVSLTATPAPGSRFTGWTGACTNQQGPCELNMTDNKVVTARFTALDSYRLTVEKRGSGQGAVTSTPVGIDCGSSCESSYWDGTEVTLTASASDGSRFTGWSGACSGTGPCQVTMSEARQVVATFDQIPSYMLDVVKQGNGEGMVTSSPSGIECGTACEASYRDETEVVLSASAAGNSTFTGWSGACSGTGSCQVTMSEATQVTATFAALTAPRLSVTKFRLGPRRLNVTKIIRMAWVTCESGTCQIDDAEMSFRARGKAFPGTATYSSEPFGAGERRMISTRVPDEVNERLTSRKSGVAILDVKASARNGQLEEQVTRTVRQGLVRCPDSKCG